MKLYYSPTSPYVRKILILLHETGLADSVALEASSTAPTKPVPGLVAKNPLMKIPALERPEGATLYDSRVITAFLNDHAGANLYGSGARRWETLTLEATGDGIMDAALLMTFEMRLRPEDKRWNDWSESQWNKVRAACDALNTRWMSHLSGPLDMGQISVACALGYLDFRHDARGWRTGCTALAEWYDTFSARDSMVATVPPEGM